MDIDFGDLDPSMAPATKSGKFAPKDSNSKPFAKPVKREPEAPETSSESNYVAVVKMESDDIKPRPPTPVPTIYSKTEIEHPSHYVPHYDANGNVKMDTHDATEKDVGSDQQLDTEDQVIREIDVLFTSSADANSKLYVLQYPLRQHWRPYNLHERCKKFRLKPQTAEVEIEMSVEVSSENFDPDVDDDKAMANHVLSTSWKPPSTTDYAVGILIGNKLHLKPVNAVVQLRPSMQHLKPQHPSKKMNTARADVDIMDSEDIKDEKDIKQPKKQRKLQGALNEQNKDAKEEWSSLKYHGEESQLSHISMKNMVDTQESTSRIHFSMRQSDYINSLCCATSVEPSGLSVSDLLKLPLEDRYKTKLLEGPPVRFDFFKHIDPDSSVEDMFKVLKSHAQLVQGFWVAKSKLKYPNDKEKELHRDYVMLQFSKNRIYHDSQLPENPSVREKLKNIFITFARRRESFRDWKFREARDDLFIKEYPNIVEEQKKIWDRVEPQIIEILFRKSLKHCIGDKRPILNNSDNKNKNNVETKTKTTIVQPSREVMLDETREALLKNLKKIFKDYKVCSLNKIRQRLHDMAVDAPQEELLKTLNQVAVNIHGVFVSKSSPDHPQYDDFRNIVINLLLSEGPKGRVKRGSIEAAANMQLKRVPNNTEFKKVLTEICTCQNSAWVLKSGDGSQT